MNLTAKADAMKRISEEEIVGLLRELVRIPSRNPPGEEKECAEYVMKRMLDWGFFPELVREPFPNRPQVVVAHEGTEARPKLILNGHLDVVPEGDVERWNVVPFGGVVKDGKVYGRGSCDMKGGVAAMMIAAKAIKESGVRLKGNLILQFVVGEETGEPGTKHLLVDKGVKGDWGIVLEATNLKVATAEKGLAWFHMIVKGEPAHASTPELGTNAISKAMKLALALEKYDRKISEKKHRLLGRPICSVTMIEGGTKENIIPESCKLAIDRRFLPGENVHDVENELMDLLFRLKKEDPEFECDFTRKMVYEPAEIPVDSMIAEVVRKNVKEVTGATPEPYGTLGSTDVRNFINDAKIPAITWGPGDPTKNHAIDEYIEISQVIDATKVLVLTAIDLLS